MPQVMCCYETPMMLLAMGISVKNAKRHKGMKCKEVLRNSGVAPGLSK
jgi:hypothetical protein